MLETRSPIKDHVCPFSIQERMKHREICLFLHGQRENDRTRIQFQREGSQGLGPMLCMTPCSVLGRHPLGFVFVGEGAQALLGGVTDGRTKDCFGFV